jgi:hypothetical protein
MSSAQQQPNLESLLDIFSKVGNEEMQIKTLTKMVSDEQLLDALKSIKNQIWPLICWRGHNTLFKVFIEHIRIGSENLNGGKGMFNFTSQSHKKNFFSCML